MDAETCAYRLFTRASRFPPQRWPAATPTTQKGGMSVASRVFPEIRFRPGIIDRITTGTPTRTLRGQPANGDWIIGADGAGHSHDLERRNGRAEETLAPLQGITGHPGLYRGVHASVRRRDTTVLIRHRTAFSIPRPKASEGPRAIPNRPSSRASQPGGRR